MLGWAIRCAFLVALGTFALWELDLRLPIAPGGGDATPPDGASPGTTHGGDTYGSEFSIPTGDNGHFFVEATVNGTPMRFLIDTGATFVVLSKETAGDLGIRPASHEYAVRMQTANGIVHSAPVVLRQIQVGNFTARDVEALVSEAPMGESLLGLSFLERLQSYEVQRNRLVLRW